MMEALIAFLLGQHLVSSVLFILAILVKIPLEIKTLFFAKLKQHQPCNLPAQLFLYLLLRETTGLRVETQREALAIHTAETFTVGTSNDPNIKPPCDGRENGNFQCVPGRGQAILAFAPCPAP